MVYSVRLLNAGVHEFIAILLPFPELVLILTRHEPYGDRMLRYLVYLISIIYSWNK
jgi:hypothetical protein